MTDSSVTAAASPATGTADAATGTLHTGTAHAAMGAAADCPLTGTGTSGDKLDRDILDALIKLFRQMSVRGEEIAERFGVPLFCIKALHILDTSMAMKELGQRMECDPSFVTAIADTLEKRGLARREGCAVDRRVKNLVLSTEGIELKRQLEGEMVAIMPWSRGLDAAQRESFLTMILKLIDAEATNPASGASSPANSATNTSSTEAVMPPDTTASSPATPAGDERAGEVSEALDTTSAG